MKLESQGGQKTALWGSKKCIILYAGQYFDAETGLHYNYHRYYDPSLGRYLRADPIGLGGGVNLYAYASDDPINWIDIYGLDSSIPDGFWEYNKNRFTPEEFFDDKISDKQRQHHIKLFKEKNPFGWSHRGISDLSRAASSTGPGIGLDCTDKILCMAGCLSGFTESMPHKVKNAVRIAGTVFNIVMKAKGIATVTVKLAGRGFVVYSIAVTAYDLHRCSKKCSKVKCKQCEQ